jgi:prophage antirepressor-like protein
MSNLSVFEFESNQVRIITVEGEPWFVAKDLCDVLGISKHRDAISRLDDDERGSFKVDTLGGKQDMATVSESGMYALVLSSRKPEAKPFRKWVTAEVLPNIRKTGKYEVEQPTPEQPDDPDISNAKWLALVKNSLLQAGISQPLAEGVYLNGLASLNPAIASSVMEAHQLLAATTPSSLLLTPTAIGKQMGISARKVNQLLTDFGFQVKNPDKSKSAPNYVPTERGKAYANNTIATGHSGDSTTYQHLKWQESIVGVLQGLIDPDVIQLDGR